MDTHALLWLLTAFALGTILEPPVDLAAARFVVDNAWLAARDAYMNCTELWGCFPEGGGWLLPDWIGVALHWSCGALIAVGFLGFLLEPLFAKAAADNTQEGNEP